MTPKEPLRFCYGLDALLDVARDYSGVTPRMEAAAMVAQATMSEIPEFGLPEVAVQGDGDVWVEYGQYDGATSRAVVAVFGEDGVTITAHGCQVGSHRGPHFSRYAVNPDGGAPRVSAEGLNKLRELLCAMESPVTESVDSVNNETSEVKA